MELQLTGKTFAVGGATSGLGRAITERLITEGAHVLAMARTQDALDALKGELGDGLIPYAIDLTDPAQVDDLLADLKSRELTGVVLNAGGPPTGRVEELRMTDWDAAYASTLRWKLQLTAGVLPQLRKRDDGRLLYVESVSIKQPIDNLVLSNALRAAVAGYAKTLSREVGATGLTVNVLAPGYHATPRITTVLEKSAEIQGVSLEEATRLFAAETALGRVGDPADFAGLAALLLSPLGSYITGQVLSVDGGLTRGLMG